MSISHRKMRKLWLIWILVLFMVVSIADEVEIYETYTETTKRTCRDSSTTEEVCRYECLNFDNHQCIGGYDTVCRNNVLNFQDCVLEQFSYKKYAQNATDDWVLSNEVFRITKHQDDIIFHYDGNKGTFNITFEVGAIYNGNYYSMASVVGLVPGLNFQFPVNRTEYSVKYSVNISNVTQAIKDNTEYITLTYKDHSGFTLGQLKKSGRKYYIKGVMDIGFEDLIKNNNTISINISERRIYIGNLSFQDDWIYLDPMIMLQTADIDNLADTTVKEDDPSCSDCDTDGSMSTQTDSGYNHYAYIKWNISQIPENSFIYYANLSLYTGSVNADTVSVYHLYNSYSWPETVLWAARAGSSDYNNTAMDSVALSGSNTFYYWNITHAIRECYRDNDLNCSVMLQAGGNNFNSYATKESGDTGWRPKVNISYSNNFSISDCYILNDEGLTYYLTSDISGSTTNFCMDITAENVTLDCKGNTIDGDGAADYGIRVRANYAHIKNCTIKDWDTAGVFFANTYKSKLNLSIVANNTDYDFLINGNCNNDIIDTNGSDNKPIIYENKSVNIQYWNNNVSQIIMCGANDSTIVGINLSRSIAESYGILFYDTHNVTVANSTFYNLTGIGMVNTTNNTFYNNLFNLTNYFDFVSSNENNFNISETVGTRIKGDGTDYAGNYWTNHTATGHSDTCADIDYDGFCDTSYTLETNNVDMNPLSNNSDIIAPYYQNNTFNNSNPRYNATVNFTVEIIDNKKIDSYKFAHNSSGTMTNLSAIDVDGVAFNISANLTVIKYKNTEICGMFWFNDSAGNQNSTNTSCFVVTNTPAVVQSVTIQPAPAGDADDLTFINVTGDADTDAITGWEIRWYESGTEDVSELNKTTLSNTLTSAGDNWSVLLKAYDGENWSDWTASPNSTIGDTTEPVLFNDSLSSSSGQNDAPFTVRVNVNETNAVAWVRVEIENPNTDRTNYSMVPGNVEGNHNYTYTPSTDGTYRFQFFARDGNGNIGSLDSTLTYVETTIIPGQGSGGGGGQTEIIKETEVNVTIEDIEGICGNGKCEANEDPLSCPRDCVSDIFNLENIFCTPFLQCGNWINAWFTNLMIILTIVFMTLVFTFKDYKNKKVLKKKWTKGF